MSIERDGKKGGGNPPNEAMKEALAKAGVVKPADDQAKAPPPQPKAQQQSQQQQKPQNPRGTENMSNTDFSNGRRSDQTAQQFTLGDADRFHRRPVARFAGSQRLRQLGEAITKELEASLRPNDANQFQIIQLDQSQTKLTVPLILLVQAAQAGGQTHSAVFSMLLNSPDIRLANRVEKDNGRSVEVPTVIGDIYNSKDYWARIQQVLGDMLPKGAQIHDAGGLVVPASFSVENDNLHELVYRATVATWTVMNSWVQLEDESPYTVAGRSRGEILTARLNFSGEVAKNAVGQPIRSDVTVELDSSTPGQGQEAFLTPTQMLVKVGGFIQPMFAQPVQNPNPNGPREDQPYWAQLVITDIDSGYEAYDLEVLLLAISTSTILSNTYAWADAFRPRYARKGVAEDLRDIGALGYALIVDGKPGQRIDTKTEAFLPNFGNLIRDNFRNGLLYSIDVPEIGENAWAFDVFRAAANGDAQAYNQIITAADNLTGNEFSTCFAGGPIVADDNNRIHLGQYLRREDNMVRDIRDIDYLAVLNLFGKTSPKTAVDFAETFSPKTGPLATRLDTRLKIIAEALSDDFELTGYANRLPLFSEFVLALNLACDRAGLVVNPGNVTTGLGSGQILGGYDVGAYAVRGNMNGMFNAGRGGYDATSGYQQQGRRRFGQQ